MFPRLSCAALAACALFASTAQAQVAITADLGTTGPGVHLVVPMETYLNGRFGVSSYSRDTDKSSAGIDYQVKTTLRTVDILFDYFPGSSALRLTAGLVYNGNKFDGTGVARADGTYSINGHSYTAADVGTLAGGVNFRRVAPYLGIGWGNPLAGAKRGWSFGGDLGAFYQGRPNASLVSHGCTTSTTVCKALATDVEAERSKFADDIGDAKVYPVARVSVAYSF